MKHSALALPDSHRGGSSTAREDIWSAVVATVREAMAKAGLGTKDIASPISAKRRSSGIEQRASPSNGSVSPVPGICPPYRPAQLGEVSEFRRPARW